MYFGGILSRSKALSSILGTYKKKKKEKERTKKNRCSGELRSPETPHPGCLVRGLLTSANSKLLFLTGNQKARLS